MKLHVFLHEQLCAVLDTGERDNATEEKFVYHSPIAGFSTAWKETPSPDQLILWLDGCLPESGTRVAYANRARTMKLALGASPQLVDPIDLLWANTDAEYPGAVHFRRGEEEQSEPAPGHYARLTDSEIGERLYEAWRTADQTGKGAPRSYPERRTSLSGMRGKIGLSEGSGGTWLAAHGSALNTWIAKREDSRKLLGEAGVESICQRSLAWLGIPAAKTLSRVFADQQCVLSERSDRYFDREAQRVRARHQEEFCQACAWPPGTKYDQGTASEPRWERAYAILDAYSADPLHAHGTVTRILAATWALGHTDLHRRNLGFLHARVDEPPAVEVAPVYDVSSGIGVETHIHFELAIGVARQRAFHKIGPRQWLQHANETGQDSDMVLAIVNRTLRELPDALAAARDAARAEDENREQRAVDARVEKMLRHVERRQREWQHADTQMRKKGARGLGLEEITLANALIALDERHGRGRLEIQIAPNGTLTVAHLAPLDGERREAGTARSARALAVALVHTDRHRPEEITTLERKLEHQRRQERVRARTRTRCA